MLALAAAGCGGGEKPQAATKLLARSGFSVRVPADWRTRARGLTSEARDGKAIVSVTTFTLPRPFEPSQWEKEAVPELDRVAAQVAEREGARITSRKTSEIGGVRGRLYVLDHDGAEERIGFVLSGRREYELFCRDGGEACDLLFSSFRLPGR